MDKVSAFTQNDAGKSLSDAAKTLDLKNATSLASVLKAQTDSFTGDAATKSITSKVVETLKAVGDVIKVDKATTDAAAKVISDATAAKVIADAAAAKVIADKATTDTAAKATADKATADAATKANADKATADAATKANADKATADAATKANADKATADAATKATADKATADAATKATADKATADAAAAKVISDVTAAKNAQVSQDAQATADLLKFGNHLISQNGSTDTTAGVDTFNISSGNYTHTISGGFTSGDTLNFFLGAILNIVPDTNENDNSQSITADNSPGGAKAMITFTNLLAGQDAGIFNVPTLQNYVAISTIAPVLQATNGNDTFEIMVGKNVTINGFAKGDILKLFANAVLNVVPDNNQTDGSQQVTVKNPVTGPITVITLTGITASQDASVTNSLNFVTQFGSGSIA
jgi:hypothetical protein